MDVAELGEEPVRRARARLRRVEGQVQAVQRMLDDDEDCEQLLRQIAAASRALRRVGVQIAVEGLERCVAQGDDGTERERFQRAFLELS